MHDQKLLCFLNHLSFLHPRASETIAPLCHTLSRYYCTDSVYLTFLLSLAPSAICLNLFVETTQGNHSLEFLELLMNFPRTCSPTFRPSFAKNVWCIVSFFSMTISIEIPRPYNMADPYVLISDIIR